MKFYKNVIEKKYNNFDKNIFWWTYLRIMFLMTRSCLWTLSLKSRLSEATFNCHATVILSMSLNTCKNVILLQTVPLAWASNQKIFHTLQIIFCYQIFCQVWESNKYQQVMSTVHQYYLHINYLQLQQIILWNLLRIFLISSQFFISIIISGVWLFVRFFFISWLAQQTRI